MERSRNNDLRTAPIDQTVSDQTDPLKGPAPFPGASGDRRQVHCCLLPPAPGPQRGVQAPDAETAGTLCE